MTAPEAKNQVVIRQPESGCNSQTSTLNSEARAMFKKISVLYLTAFIALFSAVAALCLADEEEELYQARVGVCSLIEAGKFAEADSATEKLIIEFTDYPLLPEALYWIAERFERKSEFDRAILNYQRIIQDHPESTWAEKAKLGDAKSNAMSLIMSGQYDRAKEVIDKMTDDFAGNPDLPEMLYWIAERYQRASRFEDASRLYERIVDDYRGSPWAEKAGFAVARNDAMALIMSEQFDQTKDAIDKLAGDFAGNPDLPETLYWIAERYQRVSRFEDAKTLYERIVDNYPHSPWAAKAGFAIARAEVMLLFMAGDYSAALEAVDELARDFTGNPDLPGALYWIAERYDRESRFEQASRIYLKIAQNYPGNSYAGRANSRLAELGIAAPVEQQDSNQADQDVATVSLEQEESAVELYRLARDYEQKWPIRTALARQTYQQVIEQYPGTIKADNAVLDIRRLEIQDALDAGDENTAQALMDKFVTDFRQHPYAVTCLYEVAEHCFLKAMELDRRDQPDQAQNQYAKTEEILQRIVDYPPDDFSARSGFDKVYFHIARCRRLQRNWPGAVEYFQKIIDEYPDSEYAPAYDVQVRIGECYEALRDSNDVPKEEINPLIEETYKELLTKYPDNPGNADTMIKLGWLSFEQGRLQEAVSYFENALTKFPAESKPTDALYALGRYYQQTGQNEKAVKAYEELLEILPEDDPQVENINQKLLQITELTQQ